MLRNPSMRLHATNIITGNTQAHTPHGIGVSQHTFPPQKPPHTCTTVHQPASSSLQQTDIISEGRPHTNTHIHTHVYVHIPTEDTRSHHSNCPNTYQGVAKVCSNDRHTHTQRTCTRVSFMYRHKCIYVCVDSVVAVFPCWERDMRTLTVIASILACVQVLLLGLPHHVAVAQSGMGDQMVVVVVVVVVFMVRCGVFVCFRVYMNEMYIHERVCAHLCPCACVQLFSSQPVVGRIMHSTCE